MPSQKITLRPAAQGDSCVLLKWRNDAETIRNSISKTAVDAASHEVWFSRVMSDPDCLLFIGEIQGHSIGMVRFDFSLHPNGTGVRGVVNINMMPQARGKGFGKALLETAIQELDANVLSLEAVVRETNLQSRNLFENLKFEYIHKCNDLISYELLLK